MRKMLFRVLPFIAVLSVVSISCNLISTVQDRVGGVRATAEFAATKVEEGKELLSTGQAIVTQVQGNEIVQTALAVATEQGPAMLATAQTFATQQGPSLIATAEAFATQSPDMLATAQAFATQSAAGEGPADIPLLEGDRQNFLASDTFVSYSIAISFAEVKTFYQQEMVTAGWELDENVLETSENWIATYQREGRTATLNINQMPGSTTDTFILVAVENQ